MADNKAARVLLVAKNAAGEDVNIEVSDDGFLKLAADVDIDTSGLATSANQTTMIAAQAQPTVAATVTLHDSNAQAGSKGIWVGTGGNLTGRLSGDGSDRVWKNIPSGTYVPGNFTLLKSTGTNAADILAYS